MRHPPEWSCWSAALLLALAVLLPTIHAGQRHGWAGVVVAYLLGCLALVTMALLPTAIAYVAGLIGRLRRH